MRATTDRILLKSTDNGCYSVVYSPTIMCNNMSALHNVRHSLLRQTCRFRMPHETRNIH